MGKSKGKKALVVLLTLLAMGCLAWAFYSPIWWVSLKAPNYPADAFPQGVRIHIHVTGVQNGCTLQVNDEIYEDEPLDCVHEMNTINHYIGMAPMERGGVKEIQFAPYGFLAMGVGCLLFLVWGGKRYWIFALPTILVPAIFVIDFAGWLWWFGHNLHPWGAFTVKPFMPTVFGEGKVAQFLTYSFPHYGFGLLIGAALLMLLAVLLRRKALKECDC